PDLVRNILRGFVEAIHYMKIHRKESLVILAKYLKTDDTDALEEAYESIIQALIPEKPYPTLKGIDIILRELGVKDPNARSAKPAAQEYTVKAGDTLSKLAERFYNSMSKWERIYEANKDNLKNPNYIYIGQKLMIPSDDQAS